MHKRRLLGIVLLLSPAAVAVGVGLSTYEWVWNRTRYSIPISCAAALVCLCVMALGLHFLSDARKTFIRRAVTLAAVLCVVQLFNVADVADLTKSAPLGEGRTAFALRYAGFGSAWTDLYVTQPKWLILRETYHVRQYELAAVTEIQADGDGGLRVLLQELGKPPAPTLDIYSANDLQRIKERVTHPARL